MYAKGTDAVDTVDGAVNTMLVELDERDLQNLKFSFKKLGNSFKKAATTVGNGVVKGAKAVAPYAKQGLHVAASAATVAAPIASAVAPEFAPAFIGGAAGLKAADGVVNGMQLVELDGQIYAVPIEQLMMLEEQVYPGYEYDMSSLY